MSERAVILFFHECLCPLLLGDGHSVTGHKTNYSCLIIKKAFLLPLFNIYSVSPHKPEPTPVAEAPFK